MRILFLTLSLIGAAILGRAQTAQDYPSDVLHDYFEHQLEMIKVTPGFTPPVASRALSYAGLAAYESVVHGNPGRVSFVGIIPQLVSLPLPYEGVDYHWAEVANHAVYQVVAGVYSNASEANLDALLAIRDEYSSLHAADADLDLPASAQYGTQLGNAILVYSSTDGQMNCQMSNFPEDYVIPEGPGLWSPLPGQGALQPYWGDKRCFVVEYVDTDMLAPEPPEFSDQPGSDLYDEAMVVYNAVNNVTPEELIIAQYWADGGGTVTPPGHSISMLRQILILENSDLAFSAEAYARLGFGVADAFVQCWKTKYVYNLERPITYIQSYIDPDWMTLIGTPPFPEYTSGHSSQSGAFGSIMTALFGDDYAFTDYTHGDEFGGPRSFNSFIECALETAISRLYGGIHYPIGNDMGTMSGMDIGDMVNDLFDMAVNVENLPSAEAVQLNIYPNPSNGVITLQGDYDSRSYLHVYSITGSLVSSRQVQRTMDVSDLPVGMYIVALADQNGLQSSTTKFILQ